MSTVRTIARHTLIYGLSSVIGRVINFALTPIYVNVFGPADYGLFSDLYALLAYPLVVLTFGMETSLFRFGESDVAGRRLTAGQAYTNAAVLVGALGLVAGVVGWLSAAPVARLLGYAGQADLVRLLVVITVADVWAAVPMARLRQREHAARFAAISLANIGLTVALNLAFLFIWRWGVEGVFWANAISSVVRLGLALIDNLPPSWRADAATLRTMAHYGAYITLAGLAGQLNEMLDKNLLPRLWPEARLWAGRPRTGLEMNGIYAANYKLGMFIVLAGQAFRYAVEPYFLRQQVADEAAHRRGLAQVFHYFMLAGLVTLLGVAAFAPEIVAFDFWGLFGRRTFIPKAYWVGLTVVPLVLLANLALAAYTSFGIWYKRTSQLRYGLLFALVGLVLTVALNALLIPHWGYIGCAVAHLVCYGVMAALCYGVGQHYYPVPYRLDRLGQHLLLVGLALGAMAWLGSTPRGAHPAWPLWKAAICAVVIGVVAWRERAQPVFKQ